MDNDEIRRDHERARQEAWLAAWRVVAGASNCADSSAPTRWADTCLRDFDARFPNPSIGEQVK